VSATCNQCGKPLASDALGGNCPECLFKAGLVETRDVSGATASGSGAAQGPLKPSELAPLFPQLEIIECIGHGGMGAVYKARQPKLGRLVALKILGADKEHDSRFTERFLREAQALARLNHPNIVTIHDFGEVAGLFFLLMEFVDGISLRALMEKGRMTPEQALAIVPRVCEALQFAHEHGIVHRDIKPENILLDTQGRVKIADFGIAKITGVAGERANLTADQQVIGTPHYMAPEQVEHPRAVDHRADIFSLGVVFYEMLTGELPLGKFSPPSRKVRIDVRLDEVVLHALEKEPERRYQRANEVKTAVETIASTPQEKATDEALSSSSAWWRKPSVAMALAGAALAVVLWMALSEPADPPVKAPQVKYVTEDAHGTPAVPPARFVRLVIDRHSLTLDGRATSWELLAGELEQFTNRANTVLEWGIAGDNATLREQGEYHARVLGAVGRLGFLYISFVGVQPAARDRASVATATNDRRFTERLTPVTIRTNGAPSTNAFQARDLRLAPAVPLIRGALLERAEALLNDDQRAVIAWTDRQFRGYFDRRTFDEISDDERETMEARLLHALKGPENRQYYEAINTLGALRTPKATAALREIAFSRLDKNNRDRWMAIRALGLAGDTTAVPDMIHLVYHGNVNTRWWAQVSLVRLTGQNFGTDWKAWGFWWNQTGGEPQFTPQVIRWWDGQPQEDSLAATLAEGDRKFLGSLRGD